MPARENDPTTGAVMTPIYATSTYAQSSPGVHKGFEYAPHAGTRRAWHSSDVSPISKLAQRVFAFPPQGWRRTATVLDCLEKNFSRP